MTENITEELTQEAQAADAALTAKRQYKKSADRRQDIMAAVVTILAQKRQEKFTTKEISAAVGVSEACLYRHFKTKSEILLGLLAFCDSSFVSMFRSIDGREGMSAMQRAFAKMQAMLQFTEVNPGLCRVLTGEALVYESPETLDALNQVLARAETTIKSTLKVAVVEREVRADANIAMHANLMMTCVQGRWKRFSQSGFDRHPLEGLSAMQRMFCRIDVE